MRSLIGAALVALFVASARGQEFARQPGAEWQPRPPETTAAYPGPLACVIQGRCRAPRAAPRSPPPSRFDGAAQQPQVPSTYAAAAAAAPDLAQYVTQAQLRAALNGYATRAEIDKLVKSSETALNQHGAQIGGLAVEGDALKNLVEKLRVAQNKNAQTIEADIKTVIETTRAKLTELNDVVQSLAATPGGQQIVAAGGNWLDQTTGFAATAILTKVFTFAGLPGVGLAIGAWLVSRRLKNQTGGAGGAAGDPFRGLRGRVRPVTETDGADRGDEYRGHR